MLVTQPESDYTTRYISCWAEKVILFSEKKRLKTVTLKRKRANRKEFTSVLKKTDYRLLFLNGHGSETAVFGGDNKPILEIGKNEELTKEKIVYALSCRSAKVLGKQCVKKSADAYLGYDEDFIFAYDQMRRTKPASDKTAALFLDPSNILVISLIKGHNCQRSHKNSQNAFKRTIFKILSSQSKKEERSYLRYLTWDMNHQVRLGKKEVTLT